MNKESLKIILNQFKQEHITEEEALTLIDDLCKNYNTNYIYPWYQPHTVWEADPKKFEITCKQELKND